MKKIIVKSLKQQIPIYTVMTPLEFKGSGICLILKYKKYSLCRSLTINISFLSLDCPKNTLYDARFPIKVKCHVAKFYLMIAVKKCKNVRELTPFFSIIP